MTTQCFGSSYTRVHEYGPAETSNTNQDVEMQSLNDRTTLDQIKRNTKFTCLTFQPTSLPLHGPAALLAIVLLTSTAVGVLLASHRSPIEQWEVQDVQIQPQVWLSVLSTIMDGLTMFAFAKVAEITYWRTVAHGTTLRKMYDLYESQPITGALRNLFCLRGDSLAVVSVLCLMSALRSPLFQRASMVDGDAVRHIVGNQKLKVAQIIPPNFLFQGSVGNPLLFDGAYNAYADRAPILINMTNNENECGDRCEGKVKVRVTA